MTSRGSFDAVLFFSALADRTRLRLINLMRNGEVCVCFFAEALGTNNPKISRHLSYLKRAALVAGRREGKWMHYSLTPPIDDEAAKIFAATLEMLAGDMEMSADRTKLDAVCCSPTELVTIGGRAGAK